MKDDLSNFRPGYLKLLEDMERFSAAFEPSVTFYEQLEQAFAPIRRQHLELSRALEHSLHLSSPLADILEANRRWIDLIDLASASTRVFEELSVSHQTWLDKIKLSEHSIAQLQAVATLSLENTAFRLTVTEGLFARIDFEALKARVALPQRSFPKLERLIRDVTFTYEKLAASIQTFSDLTQLPTFALPGATRELFTTGHALDVACRPNEPRRESEASELQLITEVKQETSLCIQLLEAVDPALARPYIGAHEALRGSNPDRARHILSSLREFWNHLLRRLAPDEHVVAWMPSDDNELLHEGRPTRRARVLYICRDLNHKPLTDFVDQDTRALAKLVGFFDRMHELEQNLTDEELGALLLRSDSWIIYILQLAQQTAK